jgi:hypothetical protein
MPGQAWQSRKPCERPSQRSKSARHVRPSMPAKSCNSSRSEQREAPNSFFPPRGPTPNKLSTPSPLNSTTASACATALASPHFYPQWGGHSCLPGKACAYDRQECLPQVSTKEPLLHRSVDECSPNCQRANWAGRDGSCVSFFSIPPKSGRVPASGDVTWAWFLGMGEMVL